jgi:predicted transcriptional regulator
MSDRTEQLILMLTPEEKARIERLARVTQQTMLDTVIAGVEALEEHYGASLDDDDEQILENLRQGLRDVQAGRVRQFNSLRELLDSPDAED